MTKKMISQISRIISTEDNIEFEKIDFAKNQIEKILKKEKARHSIIKNHLEDEKKSNLELNEELLNEINYLKNNLDKINTNIEKLNIFLMVLEEKKVL